jgi:hypothetical protein
MEKRIFLLVTSLILLIATIYAQSYQPIPSPLKGGHYPQKQSKKNEQIANYRYYASHSLITRVERNINATQAKDHPKNSATQNDNSPTYNWGFWITVAIAFFAGVQAATLIYQYYAMRNQVSQLQKTVKVTKQAAKAAQLNAQAVINTERAWIVIHIEPTTLNQFSFKATNIGKTPAKLISIYHSQLTVPRGEKLEIPKEYWQEGGNDFYIQPSFFPPTASRTVSQHRFESLPKRTIYFLGRIVYSITLEGTTNTPRKTRWLYMSMEGALPIPDPYHPEYNDST